MSQKEKLIKRLMSKPKDFKFEELNTLLKLLGYETDNKGKTSGSRIKFTDGVDNILLHKPHGKTNELKHYQINDILEHLKGENKI